MVKSRMNSADVAAEVACLRRLIGYRLANVYDLNPKTYVFKLAKSSGQTESGESEKILLLMESGIRLHTTHFARDKSVSPSGFTLKLRKHIRTRRLEDVRQLGIDRVVDFQFGSFHILLELYASGNLLLTDADYNVLTLLRSHRDDDSGLTMMANHHYPTEAARVLTTTLLATLHTLLAGGQSQPPMREGEAAAEAAMGPESERPTRQAKQSGKKGKEGGRRLKSVLSDGIGYGPGLIEHIILEAGLEPARPLEAEGTHPSGGLAEVEVEALCASLHRFEGWLRAKVEGEEATGWILQQAAGGVVGFSDFSPLLLSQQAWKGGAEVVAFPSFDSCLDEYFSKIEGQRAAQQRAAAEGQALSKLDKIRSDQMKRAEQLRREMDVSVHKAELIEYNLEEVDAALNAVQSALATGMDWGDLKRMIKEEKKAGNPVAALIASLELESNQATLLLSNNYDEMDDAQKTLPVDKVEVDLQLSAYGNARRWFEAKKRHALKEEKTVAAHAKALKAAEKKTMHQLAQAKVVASISHLRKVHWFEKFHWFITSENYLVLAGRDAQQNEALVKKYLGKGDIYVHADLHGAATTIIKNTNPENDVPPLTLTQAATFTICFSSAWDAKIITSAWWVNASQVSKTAPSGEYLATGSFMVRGKKNFLPPLQLVMGFGFLFRLHDTSLEGHRHERSGRGMGEEEREEVGKEEGGREEKEEEESRMEVEEEEEEGGGEEEDVAELLDRAFSPHSVAAPAAVVVDKYGLEAQEQEAEDGDGEGEGKEDARQIPVERRDRAYVSKAARRRMKGSGGEVGNNEVAQKGKEEEGGTVGSRGKKGKMKKANEKYAEQDEEERSLKMALLASAGNKEKKEKEKELAVEGPPEVVRGGGPYICFSCKQSGHVAKECPNLAAARQEEGEKGEEEEEEYELAQGKEEREKLSELGSLTGMPLPGDVLLYAVPVCGPYNALQGYKYRAKLTPGSAKKGKAAKSVVDLFLRSVDTTRRESELMKVVEHPELVAAMIGNVKVTAPGLTKAIQSRKKGMKMQAKPKNTE